MSQAERIVEKFGGIRPMARALGHRHASLVQYWAKVGVIPEWHRRAVLEAGASVGVTENDLRLTDEEQAEQRRRRFRSEAA